MDKRRTKALKYHDSSNCFEWNNKKNRVLLKTIALKSIDSIPSHKYTKKWHAF